LSISSSVASIRDRNGADAMVPISKISETNDQLFDPAWQSVPERRARCHKKRHCLVLNTELDRKLLICRGC
jgi:hypothetical protein